MKPKLLPRALLALLELHPATEGILLVDASNASNALNRKSALNNLKNTCPEFYFSGYVNNLYGATEVCIGDAELFVAGSGDVVISCEVKVQPKAKVQGRSESESGGFYAGGLIPP